jgi:predicted membrane chloride channel (bestrophin family)
VIVPTITSCCICVVVFQNPDPVRLGEHLEWPAWVFSTVLAFAIIFRTALAYRRFWEGVTASMKMLSLWRSAYASMLSLLDASLEEHRMRGNDEIVEEVLAARQRLLHWFSLLFAVAVQTLQWREEPNLLRPMHESECAAFEQRPFWSQITENEKIDRVYIHSNPSRRERVLLANSFDKLTTIIHWIEHEVSKMHLFNHLYIHSSILTRIYEELSGGSLAYCEAHTIAFIPFPFLFAQVLSYALYSFSVLCPFIVQASLGEQAGGLRQEPFSWPALVVMNVLLVAGFAGLNEIATELEDPFTEKLNNFPLRVLQRRVDCTLENVAEIGLPKDFSIAHFGEESRDMLASNRNSAIRRALDSRRRNPPDSAVGPLAALLGACEELRLAVAGCVRDIHWDSRQARREAQQLELDACEAAYRVLLERGTTPGRLASSSSLHAGQSSLRLRNIGKGDGCQGGGRGPRPGASLRPLELPPDATEELPQAQQAAGSGSSDSCREAARGNELSGHSQPWDKEELRRLLRESAKVNATMSPLLIQEMCFNGRQSGYG